MQLLNFFIIRYVAPIGFSLNELLREERNPGIVGKMRALESDRLWIKPWLLNLFGFQFSYLEKKMIISICAVVLSIREDMGEYLA